MILFPRCLNTVICLNSAFLAQHHLPYWEVEKGPQLFEVHGGRKCFREATATLLLWLILPCLGHRRKRMPRGKQAGLVLHRAQKAGAKPPHGSPCSATLQQSLVAVAERSLARASAVSALRLPVHCFWLSSFTTPCRKLRAASSQSWLWK